MTLCTSNRLTDLSVRIRHRAIINNDGSAVPIWELAGGAIKALDLRPPVCGNALRDELEYVLGQRPDALELATRA